MTPWQSQSKSTCDAIGQSGSALPSRPRRTEEAYELDPQRFVEVSTSYKLFLVHEAEAMPGARG
jgi:hypothetical protein